MAAITSYTTLGTALSTWDERDHSSDFDEILGLAEGEFRLNFAPNFAKEASVTLTFASGSATLPTGYIRALALTHSTYGGLKQVSIAAVRDRRIIVGSGIPDIYAVTGSTVEVASTYDGDMTFDFEGTLTGLSGSNPTNWLITNAPQAYLAMCMHFAKAKYEDPSAPAYKASALDMLDKLGVQSMVGQFSRSSVTLPGVTP